MPSSGVDVCFWPEADLGTAMAALKPRQMSGDDGDPGKQRRESPWLTRPG